MCDFKVGDHVGFKSDVEQYGKVIDVIRNTLNGECILVIENKGGFTGDYIGGQTTVRMEESECWEE